MVHGEHCLVLIAQKIDYALRDIFGKECYCLCVEVARFERHFDYEYFFDLVAGGDSRNGAGRNPINEVKT